MDQIWRAFGHTIPLIVAMCLIITTLAFVIYLFKNRRYGVFSARRSASWAGLAASVAVAVAITLSPGHGVENRTLELVPFRRLFDGFGQEMTLTQMAANFALFVPIGIFLALALQDTSRRWSAAILAVGFPLMIEITQYLFVPGRVAAAEDWIVCSAGIFVGLALGYGGRRMATSASAMHRTSPRTPNA
ncbi:VanZ family protein [Phytoactinopolyspora limicola]|uniref:VanZ family protein n=1 Tax=Phytoactinopolyspora limicola TaxID=2715536 RepID=UPI0014083C50|nr:VanZ family protein [Phytoactinopolyspora limicola]